VRTDKLRHILAQTLMAGTKRGEAKRDSVPSAKEPDEKADTDGEPVPTPSPREQ